ncbi:uncharacterized protein LOC142984634 isoform X2 [Anticarsia gemmatalis]|uniref:uncharacterized protein LOC142984634 isoform X2 n=1 Tax=Anticarsia gemmatalis TaxID=129554 RepID=UPI003F762536
MYLKLFVFLFCIVSVQCSVLKTVDHSLTFSKSKLKCESEDCVRETKNKLDEKEEQAKEDLSLGRSLQTMLSSVSKEITELFGRRVPRAKTIQNSKTKQTKKTNKKDTNDSNKQIIAISHADEDKYGKEGKYDDDDYDSSHTSSEMQLMSLMSFLVGKMGVAMMVFDYNLRMKQFWMAVMMAGMSFYQMLMAMRGPQPPMTTDPPQIMIMRRKPPKYMDEDYI